MAKRKLHTDDCDSPDRRPCFYKIMWFANLIDLRIPPDFKKHLLNEESEWATLRSPCGNWDIKLQQQKGDTYLAEGWEEFVKYHSLGDKLEFLVFVYNGNMCFDVMIFDKNGCARSYQESASSFISSFPSFKHSLKDYNIGAKSCLLIPKAFSRVHFPGSTPRKIILRNSKGISWSANIILTYTEYLSISAGWKAFSDDNSLKKGDVCIFELVDKKTMQVHISDED